MQDTLTRSQLGQIVEEYTRLRDWVTVRDFCNQVYGEGVVASVSLETHGEYDDEGGTDYHVESLYAVSSDGSDINFDLSLPFWKYLATTTESTPTSIGEDEQDWAMEVLRDWYFTDEKDIELVLSEGWMQWSQLPCDSSDGELEFFLASPPKVTYPIVNS